MTLGTSSQADFVDLEKIAGSMTLEISSCWSAYGSNANKPFSIHRVPQHILEIDRNAYEPIILSIGPYNHGARNLLDMEKEKWKSLDYILKMNCEVSLQDYIKVISKLEKDARSCYFEEITMDRKKFLRMLLLDACFILVKVGGTVLSGRTLKHTPTEDTNNAVAHEKVEDTALKSVQAIGNQSSEHVNATDNLILQDELSKTYDHELETKNSKKNCGYDAQHSSCGDWYANFAWHDLFLLENQMPFFLIEAIYELAVSNSLTNALLRDKIVECVEDILRQFPNGFQESRRPRRFQHMLHLCHMYMRPTQKFTEIQQKHLKDGYFHRLIHFGRKYFGFGFKLGEREPNHFPIQEGDCFLAGQLPIRWRRASQYHDAGIGLKRREYNGCDRHSLLDIKFHNGVIEIPCLVIDENTESLFKNLVALEQTEAWYGNDLTAYVISLSQLVSMPEDATLLSEKGIIVHILDSDDEIPDLFTRLNKQVTFYADSDYYLKSLCQILEAHYQSRINRWIAWLWMNHFSNPWLALALVATVIVLLCTLVQTIYTVLAYTHPPTIGTRAFQVSLTIGCLQSDSAECSSESFNYISI